MRRGPSLTVARTVGRLSRRLGRGGGTSAPGKVLLRIRPGAIERLAADLSDGTVMISATNGKTTTARFVARCLEGAGLRSVANGAGANLLSGVATALLDGAARRPPPQVGLFEVDEMALPEVARRMNPRVVVLMNLFRDQLDRYGELESIAERWSTLVADLPDDTILVLNADDPTVAELADGRHRTLFFGVDDPHIALEELPHASDSTRCRRCGHALIYERVTLGHMGDWKCSSCDAARPARDVAIEAVALDGTRGSTITLRTPSGAVTASLSVPGIHNAYNAAAATAAAIALGISNEVIATALAAGQAAFGRAERITIDDRDAVILLAKNPAGANTTVQTVLLDPDPLHLLVALNDRTADGTDVSWIWDVDYEPLLPRLARLTVTGDRAYDMALRFAYAGVARDRIEVESNPGAAFDAGLAGVPDGGSLYVLPTYTAMLDLRAVLARRGLVEEFWRDG